VGRRACAYRYRMRASRCWWQRRHWRGASIFRRIWLSSKEPSIMTAN
jgi:hypothetical protein